MHELSPPVPKVAVFLGKRLAEFSGMRLATSGTCGEERPTPAVRVARDSAGGRALRQPFRTGICGSYGGLNVGDEAILESIVRQLRARVHSHLLVFSRDREDTLRRHQVERAVDVRRLTRADLLAELGGLDLFVLGGGGILFDGEAGTFVRPLMAAHAS